MKGAEVPNVGGRTLPGGEYRISTEENLRMCEALYTEPAADGSAHPIYGYVATQSGMGVSIDGLLEICEFDVADGPMIGGSNARYFCEIQTNETYRVSGKIVSLTRKTSKKLGVIDVLEFKLTLARVSGEAVVEVTNTWILPRRGLDA